MATRLGLWITVITAIVFTKGVTIKGRLPKPDVKSQPAILTNYYTKVGKCYYWKGTKYTVKNKCQE